MPKKSRDGQQTAEALNEDAEDEPGSPRSRAKAAAVYRTRQKSKGGMSSCRVLLFGLFVVLLYVLFILCITTKPGSTAWDQRSIVKKLPNGGVAMNLKPGGIVMLLCSHFASRRFGPLPRTHARIRAFEFSKPMHTHMDAVISTRSHVCFLILSHHPVTLNPGVVQVRLGCRSISKSCRWSRL